MRLRIEKAVYGGSGLAHVPASEATPTGKAVFVPLALPGELVEAHLTKDKHTYLEAELDHILEPSPSRTTPPCPYFGPCGGCHYQQATYQHQLQIKTAILQETLERAQIDQIPPIQTLAAEPLHYRNRIRLQIQPRPFALGYRQHRSHTVLPIGQCPIAAPILEQAIATVTNLGESQNLAAICEQIELFTNHDQSALLLTLLTASGPATQPNQLAEICKTVQAELPQLTGAAILQTNRSGATKTAHTWGQQTLSYQAAGGTYQVSIGSFFQVNRYLLDQLVQLVTQNQSGHLAWDLYAGVGLFARALTQTFARVIAVESSPTSSANLRHNLSANPHRAILADTLSFLAKQNPSKSRPDLIVLDPPRAGLGPEVSAQLARIAPARIVYVSCDPTTLSRDLKALIHSGYDLTTITMVDMFPQTFHLESVAVLNRR